MAKYKLNDGPVKLTGRKVTADRTAEYDKMLDHRNGGWVLTYEPHGSSGKDLDVNALVYELMIIAGYDMLQVSKVIYGGDFTASEMAGEICYLHQFMGNCNPDWEDYKLIRIKTKTFSCSFDADYLFQQIAEWEGVAGITAKNAHRFHCEGKEMPKGTVLKPYKRCHGYKPKTISYADTDRSLADKFKVLGKLVQALSREGIRKALSVIAAAHFFENMSYQWQHVIKEAMRWKLWKDYGNCERLHQREECLIGEMQRTKDSKRYQELKKEQENIRCKYAELSRPIPFSDMDFDGGPACYQVVDDKYASLLVNHVRQMMADAPKPKWPKQGDVVLIKGAEKMQKKYQGKHLVDSIQPRLSLYGDRIEWVVAVSVGKYNCEYFTADRLEPAPEKPAKKAKVVKAKKPEAVKVKGTDYAVKSDGKEVTFGSYIPGAMAEESKPDTMTLAEQFRQALLRMVE